MPLQDSKRLQICHAINETQHLAAWRDEDGLISITSDHGNMENLSIRQHTENDVPTVVIGTGRQTYAENFNSLIDITPHILFPGLHVDHAD